MKCFAYRAYTEFSIIRIVGSMVRKFNHFAYLKGLVVLCLVHLNWFNKNIDSVAGKSSALWIKYAMTKMSLQGLLMFALRHHDLFAVYTDSYERNGLLSCTELDEIHFRIERKRCLIFREYWRHARVVKVTLLIACKVNTLLRLLPVLRNCNLVPGKC